MKKLTLSILIKFTLLSLVFIFSGCVSKFASLAETGNIEELKKEIKTVKDKQDALSWAAYYGKIKTVEYLIKNGADINYYDSGTDVWNISPAIVGAAANNKFKMVNFLVKNGANINKKSRTGHSAISISAYWGYLNIVKYLAEQGADIHASNPGGSVLKILKDNGHEYFIPVLLKIQENKKLKEKVARGDKENRLKKEQQLLAIKKQKEQINNYINKEDFTSLKNYTDKYPNSVNFISEPELRLALTGPKGMKIGDIRKLVLEGMDENIIISLIKRVKVPYKEFTLDEIDAILKMDINSKLVSTMINVTTELLKDEQKRKQQEYFLNEQNKITAQKAKVIHQNSSTQKVDAQGNPIVEKVQDELIKQGIGMLLDQLF